MAQVGQMNRSRWVCLRIVSLATSFWAKKKWDKNGQPVDRTGFPRNFQLLGEFNHLEKYEFVNGKDDIQEYPIYEMENKFHV